MAEPTSVTSMIPSISVSSVTLYWIFLVVVLLMFFGMIGWLYYMFITYNIRIRIYEKVGDSYKIKYIRGRLKKTDNVHTIKFMWKNLYVTPPDPDYYYFIGKNKGLSLYSDGHGTYFPIHIMDVEKHIQDKDGKTLPIFFKVKEGHVYNPEKNIMDMFHVNENKRAIDRYKKQDKLLQYLPMIAFAVVVVVILVLIILILQKFDVLRDVSSNLLKVAETLKDVQHIEGANLQPVGG